MDGANENKAVELNKEAKTNEPNEEAAETTLEEDEEGFTDEHPFVAQQPAEEEPQPEPTPEPVSEPEPVVPEIEEDEEPTQEEPSYDETYDDERFQRIEEARAVWNKTYKKNSRIKFIVSTVILLGILTGWLVPALTIRDKGTLPLFIGLGCAGLGIVIIFVFNRIQGSRDKSALQTYFETYTNAIASYTLEDIGISPIEGDVNCKITKEEFEESGIFENTASVGSRDNRVFAYKGMDCALAEAAASVDAGKALKTVFVGKFLRTHNSLNVSADGLVLYFSGNDRALPPAKLESLHALEKSRRYTVYGSAADKKVLTKKVREALAKIHTNKLLVDVTVVIRSGRTHWYLGYEDDIMVLPNDAPFNPQYVKEYKDQIKVVLDAALALNA